MPKTILDNPTIFHVKLMYDLDNNEGEALANLVNARGDESEKFEYALVQFMETVIAPRRAGVPRSEWAGNPRVPVNSAGRPVTPVVVEEPPVPEVPPAPVLDIKTCSEPGCNKPPYRRGLCVTHRKRKDGTCP